MSQPGRLRHVGINPKALAELKRFSLENGRFLV
jgi:hypothetical protein